MRMCPGGIIAYRLEKSENGFRIIRFDSTGNLRPGKRNDFLSWRLASAMTMETKILYWVGA